MSGPTSQLLKVYMAQAPDSDGVEEFQLRKQTPLDRLWAWMTHRPLVPAAGSWQHYLLRLFDSTLFSVVVVSMTVLALFLVDVSVLANSRHPEPADSVVVGVIFACFIFFLLEIAGSVCVQHEYFLSFFFLCDVIGTLSLIFDIPWLSGPIGLNFSNSSAAVLRASRVARTGTRATRVLRLLRTMRMPALLRCCKRKDEFDLADEAAVAAATAAAAAEQPSSSSDGSPIDEAARLRAQQHALAEAAIVNTHVGSKLQLVVSKRVIFLVTIMIFVIPLLSETDVDHSRIVGLVLLEESVSLSPGLFDPLVQTWVKQVPRCIHLDVLGKTFPSAEPPDTTHIRAAALVNISTPTGSSYALFDDTSRVYSSTVLSLCMTIFTIILFAGGSVLFTQDAERLFFKPIERMIKTIKRLANIVFEMDGASDELALDETILIEAVVARMSDIFSVRMERDGVKRKTTLMKTATSRWRIHVEEEECSLALSLALTPADLARPVRNKDLLLIHEIPELASVARCLESAVAAQYFCAFLKHEYCVEGVLFLQEVRQYRIQAERLAHQARQIYTLFLSNQAVNQVGVDWSIRRHASQRMAAQLPLLSELFAGVESDLMASLSRDHFPRFLHSIYCLKLLKHLTLERQAMRRHMHAQAANNAHMPAQAVVMRHHARGGDEDDEGDGAIMRGDDAVQLDTVELEEIRAALNKTA